MYEALNTPVPRSSDPDLDPDPAGLADGINVKTSCFENYTFKNIMCSLHLL